MLLVPFFLNRVMHQQTYAQKVQLLDKGKNHELSMNAEKVVCNNNILMIMIMIMIIIIMK